MSTILKALRRSDQDSDRDQAPPVSARVAEDIKEENVCTLGKTISYTQTKRIPLDFKALVEKRVICCSENGCHGAVEEYKLLKAQILQKARDGNWNTLMVTSVGEGEGKTITSINLALAIAQEVEETCLLVEADLRKPSIQDLFGCRAQPGLTDHLLRDLPLNELLINPGIDHFVFLPAGRSIPNSGEVLRSPKMRELVNQMKHCYADRYVIFDLPPLFECADPLVFSEYVDAVLLVVEAGKTSTDDVLRALELLDGKNIVGAVLNKVKTDNRRYYRYYYR